MTRIKNFFNKYWYKQPTDRSILKRQKRFESRVEKGKYKTKEELTSAKNSHYKLSLKYKATKAEILFGDYLWENKIYFIFQKGFFTPFHRIVDFYIPDKGTIIEIDGGYHEEILAKDNHKDFSFKEQRHLKTIRIKNEEVYDGSFKDKIKQLF